LEFDLVSFGTQLRAIRNQSNMTLEDVSELSGVNAETIRRIESGKVIPRLETLEFLSLTYKQDISSLFLKYRFNSYDLYISLKNSLENKLYYNDYSNISSELHELENIIDRTKNSFIKLDMKQLYIFIQAMVLYKKDNNLDSSLKHLIKAICITTPSFTLATYDKYIYSSMETWILLIIAIIEDDLSNTSLAMEIFQFCTKITDINDKLYIPLYYNLSYAYGKVKDYAKSLAMADKGIMACKQNMNFFGLPLLYLYKGLALFHLDDKSYTDYFNNALVLCQCFGQESFTKLISRKYKEISEV
jgi:transcriptional regulator with XRE-family HTH domain